MIRSIFIIGLLCLAACQQKKVFNKPYQFESDPFIPIYQTNLIDIENETFDSDQISNKTLDPEMFRAILTTNHILSEPEKHAPFLKDRIHELGIRKITLASAARSAYLQDRLSVSYKASYLKSFHLLGLAVDLEMKGKSFDIKSHPHDAQTKRNYETLTMVLNLAGLVFSEPVELDPNHVELYKYCRKKNPNWDREGLSYKYKLFLSEMKKLSLSKLAEPNHLRDGIDWNRILKDVSDELNALATDVH